MLTIKTIHQPACRSDMGADPDLIKTLLASPQLALNRGEAFTGRSSTQVHINDDFVLKLRRDFTRPEPELRPLLDKVINHEKQYGVHHPDKHWFYVVENKSSAIAGNIAPRLQPLHLLLAESSPDEQLTYLSELLALYLRTASKHEQRLDEGLSNFGRDQHGTIFYLDDDFYAWDGCMPLAHGITAWLRTAQWMSKETAHALGQNLQEQLHLFFPVEPPIREMAEDLSSVFIQSQSHGETLLIALQKGLREPRPQPKKPAIRNKKNSPYFAVLADIHSNYEALTVVLDYLQSHDITQGIVLGDIVGYGPNPAECIEKVQELDFAVIRGNHDHVAAGMTLPVNFSSMAKWAIEWSSARLDQKERQWLGSLPPFWQEETWMGVHGAPMDPHHFVAYIYEMTYEDNLDWLEQHSMRLCMHGHTHTQSAYCRKGGKPDMLKHDMSMSLTNYDHVLLCPGSIGQPRNGDTRTQFAIINKKENQVEFIRLPYDQETTVEKMKAEKFPPSLWTRLEEGR